MTLVTFPLRHINYIHSVFVYKQYKTWQMEGRLLLQRIKEKISNE